MNLSARARILGWTMVLMGLALMLSTGATHLVLAGRQQQQTQADLLHERDEFRSVLATQLSLATAARPARVDTVLAAATGRAVPEREVVFIGLVEGRVSSESSGPAPLELSRLPGLTTPWGRATTGTTGVAATSAGPVAYVVEPVEVAGDPRRGVFVAAVFTAPGAAALDRLTTLQIELGVIALALSSAVAWFIAGRVLRPVRETTELARRISGTDLSGRLPVVGQDEISDLAATFNTMLDRLQSLIERQKELMADVSHELRTPITVVQGNLDTIVTTSPEDAESIAVATDELTRMTHMVEDLLVLGRSEQPGFARSRPVDLGDLVTDLAGRLRALSVRRWVVSTHAEGTALLDRDLVTQAVMELGLNALRHAPGAGPLELSSRVEGTVLVLAVADRGPGVPGSDRERVFDRFVRLGPRRTTGSGLGLSIIRVIARAHGGDVIVTDRGDGPGARFELRLPVMTFADGTVTAPAASTPLPRRARGGVT